MKTICSFHFELSQNLKQLNIKFLIIPLVKREAKSIFLQSAIFLQKYKIEQIQMVNTNLPYTSSCSIFKSNLIIPLRESWKNFSSCCVIFLTYIFWIFGFFALSTPDGLPYFWDQWEVHPWTIAMRPRLLMDFTLRCVRFYPGVNSRAELVTLAPGLRPERRFAPLARGQGKLDIVFCFA